MNERIARGLDDVFRRARKNLDEALEDSQKVGSPMAAAYADTEIVRDDPEKPLGAMLVFSVVTLDKSEADEVLQALDAMIRKQAERHGMKASMEASFTPGGG